MQSPMRMSISAAALAATLALGSTLAGGAQEATPETATPGANGDTRVEAVLRNAEGTEIGTVRLEEVVTEGVQIAVDLDAGMLAAEEHGIHIHETGRCDATGETPFSSAGGHFNPTNGRHGDLGDPEGHAGDLGNLTVAADGPTTVVIPTDRFELSDLNDADGSALVIHAGRDDLTTQPSGDSGARASCAVIFPPREGATPEASPASDASMEEAFATALPDDATPEPGA